MEGRESSPVTPWGESRMRSMTRRSDLKVPSRVGTLHRVMALLALLGLSGCSEEPSFNCSVVPPAPAQFPEQPGLLRVGQQARLSITPLPPASDCGGADEAWPSAVTAEVEGPEGQPVPSEITLGPQGSPAILRFTPQRPGPHHLLVAFSQVGGLHQLDLHAMQDRSAEAPSYSLSRSCATLERTLPGAWVCGTDVLRDDELVRSFPSSLVAVAGEVIWVVSNGGLQRYVDTGTQLLLEGSLNQAMGDAVFLLAAREELVVLHGSSVERYTFSSGALRSTGAEPWSRPTALLGSSGPYGVLLREGERLAIVTRSTVKGETGVQVCPYQLLSGRFQRTEEACSLLTGDTVGFEPTVLWMRDPSMPSGSRGDQGRIRRWEWTGGRLVEQGDVTLGLHTRMFLPPLVRPSTVPLVFTQQTVPLQPATFAVVRWSAQRRVLVFEYLDGEVSTPHASPGFYWGPLPQAPVRTKILLRPAL
jgi:hypothetical protein